MTVFIVRDDRELEAVALYIDNNPALWAEDHENPDRGFGRGKPRPYEVLDLGGAKPRPYGWRSLNWI